MLDVYHIVLTVEVYRPRDDLLHICHLKHLGDDRQRISMRDVMGDRDDVHKCSVVFICTSLIYQTNLFASS